MEEICFGAQTDLEPLNKTEVINTVKSQADSLILETQECLNLVNQEFDEPEGTPFEIELREEQYMEHNDAETNESAINGVKIKGDFAEKTFRKKVLTSLEKVHYELKCLNSKVDKLENKVYMQSKSEDVDIKCLVAELSLPIRNSEELENVESFLSNPENFKEMVLFMIRLGSTNLKEFVVLAMNKIIGSEFSREWSLFGRKGKKSFNSLRCHNVIIRAALHIFNDNTEADVNKRISLYLAGAADRFGGRKERISNVKTLMTNEILFQ